MLSLSKIGLNAESSISDFVNLLNLKPMAIKLVFNPDITLISFLLKSSLIGKIKLVIVWAYYKILLKTFHIIFADEHDVG